MRYFTVSRRLRGTQRFSPVFVISFKVCLKAATSDVLGQLHALRNFTTTLLELDLEPLFNFGLSAFKELNRLDGKAELVGAMLRLGFSTDLRDGDDNTPLMQASWFELMAVVQLLLEHGAAVDAVWWKRNWTALISAACCGETEIAELLLDRGAAVHARDTHGFTALVHAAFNGFTDTAKLLLERGADVTQYRPRRCRPAH
eukprot:PhM_4_TR9561/c3_g2_i3/m.38084